MHLRKSVRHTSVLVTVRNESTMTCSEVKLARVAVVSVLLTSIQMSCLDKCSKDRVWTNFLDMPSLITLAETGQA